MKKFNRNQKIRIINVHNGCELSSLILSKLLEFFKLNHYEITDKDEDICILNSCCVIKEKRLESTKMLNKISSHNENNILFGCFAGVNIENENVIKISSKEYEKIDQIFEHDISITKIRKTKINKDFFQEYQKYQSQKERKILISIGCNNNCSYCNIKNAKGNTKSRSITTISEEIKNSCKKGDTIMLMGDDCASYGSDIGTNLIELIEKINELELNLNISIHYLFPSFLIKYEKQFLKLVRKGNIKYLCTPIQSASQRILKLMNRNYDIEKVIEIIKKIKTISPNTWLYTHYLINFPSETIKELILSLKSAKYFDDVLYLTYSENQKTKAYNIYHGLESNVLEKKKKLVNKYIKISQKGAYIK